MSQTLQIRAKSDIAKSKIGRRTIKPALLDDNRAAQIIRAVETIMKEVANNKMPFVTPALIAPRLGITDGAFRVYCREAKCLRQWKGSYKFMMDDAEHVEALRAVLSLAFWSMKGAENILKPKAH